MTLIEPYSYNVTYDDGSHASLATRERPKLIFDPTTKEPACVQSNLKSKTSPLCIDKTH